MLAKILDNPSTFSNEPAFRAGLYEKIDQDVIRELITLQSKQLKHSKSPYLRHIATAPCSNDVKGGMDAKIGSVPSAREIEEHLKTEQIDALKLKTQSLISGYADSSINHLLSQNDLSTTECVFETTFFLRDVDKQLDHSSPRREANNSEPDRVRMEQGAASRQQQVAPLIPQNGIRCSHRRGW
jgi:hypothetical protein